MPRQPLPVWRLWPGEDGANELASALPLARWEILRTGDPDEAADVVGRVLLPHRLERINGGGVGLDVRLCSYRGCDMLLSLLSYGTDVRLLAETPRRHFTVFIPLVGRADVRAGGHRVPLTPGVAALVSPRDALGMRWNADCKAVVLRIEQTALEARLSELLGSPLVTPLWFAPRIDLTSGHGLSWARMLALMIEEVDRPGVLMGTQAKAEQFERLLLISLLEGQQHTYSDSLGRSAGDGDQEWTGQCPRYVREVRRLLDDHPEWEHTISSLAEHVSYSVRGLQKGFSRHVGASPTEYLRGVRLRRVHESLLAAPADLTTAEAVARHWGFRHYGHFAGLYRKKFGESPKETLRR